MIKKNNENNYFNHLKTIISKRKTIRTYNQNSFLSEEEILKAVEIAFRAPSSYGFEPWYVLVINRKNNQKIIEELYPFFQGNKQILSASHLFFIFSYKGINFNFFTPFFRERVMWKLNKKIDFSQESDYLKKLKREFNPLNLESIDNWSRQQCFILLQNFLLVFTSMNISTNPMGGFDEKEIINYFEKKNIINKNAYNLAVTFVAGHSQLELLNRKIIKRDLKEKVKII